MIFQKSNLKICSTICTTFKSRYLDNRLSFHRDAYDQTPSLPHPHASAFKQYTGTPPPMWKQMSQFLCSNRPRHWKNSMITYHECRGMRINLTILIIQGHQTPNTQLKFTNLFVSLFSIPYSIVSTHFVGKGVGGGWGPFPIRPGRWGLKNFCNSGGGCLTCWGGILVGGGWPICIHIVDFAELISKNFACGANNKSSIQIFHAITLIQCQNVGKIEV